MIHGSTLKWYSKGDIEASTIIIFDILSVLTFISIILQVAFDFPIEIILNRLIPGTIVGVLIGNIFCFCSSLKLAKILNKEVTAMPIGIDAPSAIGFTLCILGPIYKDYLSSGMNSIDAAITACNITALCLFYTGCIKLFMTIFLTKLQKFIPQAALLGAIAGVAIALIGFFPILSIFKSPIVGIVSFVMILLTMISQIKLPFKFPYIPAVFIFGLLAYYMAVKLGFIISKFDFSVNFKLVLPVFNTSIFHYFHESINYIPIIVPFALLVTFGGMSSVEGAIAIGQTYKVTNIMIFDAISTISTSLFGGTIQTTPYAGFIAYKKLNARSAYLLINILIVCIGGFLNIVGFIVNLIPEAIIAPILLYVALEISQQAFIYSNRKHFPVIIVSLFPSIARLLLIKISDNSLISSDKLENINLINNKLGLINDNLAITILGNGFIITGMLWGTFLYYLIDKKYYSSIICLIVLSVLSYFGVIHSIFLSGKLYIPSHLPVYLQKIPLQISLGYLFSALIIFILSLLQKFINDDDNKNYIS